MILQINDIKNTQIEINVENELKQLINYEKNNQLNQYSKIYFNKIKKNLQSMNYKPIIIVAGEPNSIFFEIFFKVIKKKIKSPIILIGSKKLILNQAKILKKRINLNLINETDLIEKRNKLKKINLINVNFKQTKRFDKITSKSNKYISSCFKIAIKLLKNNISNKFINGPISKKTFLKKKFNGITEYLSQQN